ncbi:transposase [Streptomyces sp. NPDC006285]|uniref:transposase n=1 Tax=Streptomyces sp. NPDC006285 TaxID=3364742 RepID=UPI003693BCB2
MSDAEWAVVRDALPVPGWLKGRGDEPESYCHRQIVDAVRYLVAGGITWRAMPTDFPAWDRVYAFFRRWRDKGLAAEFHDRVSEAAGRDPESTAAVNDARQWGIRGGAGRYHGPRRSRPCAAPPWHDARSCGASSAAALEQRSGWRGSRWKFR